MDSNFFQKVLQVHESILNSLPVGLVVFQKEDARIVYVNDRAKELYGVDPSGLEMPEQSTKLMKLLTLDGEIYPPEKLPASRALRTGEKVNDELIIERPDNSRITVEAYVSPIKDKKDQVIAAVGVFEDVTERKKTEELLRKSEKQKESILESITDGFVAFDKHWRYIYVNANAAKMLHKTKKELLGQVAWEVFPEALKLKFFTEFNKAVECGVSLHFEEYYPEPLNIWYECHCYPSQQGLTVFFSNITERKKNEQALKEREQVLLEYHQIVDSAQDAIFTTDVSFKIKTWNHSAQRLFGWNADEVIGKSTEILGIKYPTLDGTTREQALKQLIENGFWKGEVLYHKKDGSPIPVSASISLVKNKEQITGTVAIVHDITPRKKRQQILKEARHDLLHAQKVAKIGSWRLDTKNNILVWSKENHRIFGIPMGTPMTYQTFLSTVHPDDRDYVDEQWKAALCGDNYDIEHRIVVDGKVKWVREKAELEFDEKGNVKGGFGTTQDITDFVEMRDKLRYYSKYLEEIVEEKSRRLRDAERLAAIGETAGMVGHDIRNPLQSMDGAIYLAEEYVDALNDGSEEKRELSVILELLKDQIAYIDHMVADLQDFAKSDKPALKELDLKEAINESLNIVNISENVVVNVVLPEDTLKLIADLGHIKRVLSNLVRNAVQAMPDGGELSIVAYKKDDCIWIRIEDTGCGMTDEVKSKIFTPLFTTKSKGQGFGLAVCKKLVEAHGGEISFDSEEGKGTTFTIKLPIKQGAEYFWNKKALF